MNIRHRQKDNWRKEVRIASGLQDGRFGVVTDAAINRLDNALLPKLANRAGEIIRRLGLPERSPRQGGNQAQEEHRHTPHGVHLPVCTRFLSSYLANETSFSPGDFFVKHLYMLSVRGRKPSSHDWTLDAIPRKLA